MIFYHSLIIIWFSFTLCFFLLVFPGVFSAYFSGEFFRNWKTQVCFCISLVSEAMRCSMQHLVYNEFAEFDGWGLRIISMFKLSWVLDFVVECQQVWGRTFLLIFFMFLTWQLLRIQIEINTDFMLSFPQYCLWAWPV